MMKTIVITSIEVKLPILLGNYDRQTNKPTDRPTNNINKTICLERLLERVLAGVVQGTPAQVVAQPGYKKS